MLILSRKLNETIVIDGNIRVTVVGIRGNQIRLGIEAPATIGVLREELCDSIPGGEGTGRPEAAPARPILSPARSTTSGPVASLPRGRGRSRAGDRPKGETSVETPTLVRGGAATTPPGVELAPSAAPL